MLGIAVVDGSFKNLRTLDEIYNFAPILNGNGRILEWAVPMRTLPTASIGLLQVLQEQSPLIISSSSAQAFAWHYVDQDTAGQPTSPTEDCQPISADAGKETCPQSLIRSNIGIKLNRPQ